MMMVDLDKFKRSNDLHGQQVGDAVLVETARRLGALLPNRQVLAQLGGDELICSTILQPGSEAAIKRLALANQRCSGCPDQQRQHPRRSDGLERHCNPRKRPSGR